MSKIKTFQFMVEVEVENIAGRKSSDNAIQSHIIDCIRHYIEKGDTFYPSGFQPDSHYRINRLEVTT